MGTDFYKDIKIIKWCKNCGTEWRPIRYTWQNRRLLCTKCVAKEIAAWRKKNPQKWAEIVRKYKKKARSKRLPWVLHAYEQWKHWIAQHPERRREIARKSYYKRKQERVWAVFVFVVKGMYMVLEVSSRAQKKHLIGLRSYMHCQRIYKRIVHLL